MIQYDPLSLRRVEIQPDFFCLSKYALNVFNIKLLHTFLGIRHWIPMNLLTNLSYEVQKSQLWERLAKYMLKYKVKLIGDMLNQTC